MVDTIRQAWSWTGLNPAEVIETNAFGNLLVKAVDGSIWRICPESLTCEKIAADLAGLEKLRGDKDFLLDWEMTRLVALANNKLGTTKQGRCYCFKLVPALGGKYDSDNLAEIPLEQLIAFSGDLAEQIKDVPDGGQIKIDWIP